MRTTTAIKASLARIDEVRGQLISRGFCGLASGKFGLPSYTDVEAWARGGLVLYLLYDRHEGGWDLLTQLAATNCIDATWAAVDALIAKEQPS